MDIENKKRTSRIVFQMITLLCAIIYMLIFWREPNLVSTLMLLVLFGGLIFITILMCFKKLKKSHAILCYILSMICFCFVITVILPIAMNNSNIELVFSSFFSGIFVVILVISIGLVNIDKEQLKEKRLISEEIKTDNLNDNNTHSCIYCGKPTDDDAKFCKYCGKTIK